jgi:SulP family sulfate permease
LGPVPVGIPLGILFAALTFLLLENRKLPAGLIVILGGLALGAILGTHEGFGDLTPGLYLPELIPYGLPALPDVTFALLVLVLPQIPMTLGNAVVAYTDLSREYFGDDSRKTTDRAVCISMALANFGAFLVGGMPMCHGAGGLAAHYRFGARTAGSNLMIGAVFTALALFFGPHGLAFLYLIPLAVLGVLLLFAGTQLALTLQDLEERKDLFVAMAMLGITLASNLAVGFAVGIAAAYALKTDKVTV